MLIMLPTVIIIYLFYFYIYSWSNEQLFAPITVFILV